MWEGTKQSRGPVLTTLAVFMGLLAISNFSKPISQSLAPESTAGFVFFGQRLEGMANAVVGPLFGLLLAAYAYGVWTLKAWVWPLAGAYALYVIANLILFSLSLPPDQGGGLFGLVYMVVAVAVSGGGALYLFLYRDRLH
jgi:hypothetical protein